MPMNMMDLMVLRLDCFDRLCSRQRDGSSRSEASMADEACAKCKAKGTLKHGS